MIMQAFLIILVVVLVLVAVFAIQNPGIIMVNFFNMTVSTSLLVVIIASFGVGILAALLGGVPSWLRNRRRVKELEAERASLQSRLEASHPGDRKPEEQPPAAPRSPSEFPKAAP
jgi:uncharacterized integral membrane protein